MTPLPVRIHTPLRAGNPAIAGAVSIVGTDVLPYNPRASSSHPEATMSKQTVFAVLLAMAGVAQAQAPACSCDGSATRTATNADLASLLTNRMVCANVGGEKWQEWHNGTSSGAIIDYKLGPGVQPDPSTTVGSYTVSNNTVTYSYAGGGGTYTYEVCLASGGGSYTFCGASFGGRNITGAKIGGLGLQSCTTVTNVGPGASVTRTR